MELALIMVVLIALVFDFTNGFHDTANSIATVVGTRALDPQKAVFMAAALNFVGAFISIKVAKTIQEIISPDVVTLEVVMAGLTGAIIWNVFTWAIGIPSSSSHALVGGLVGAGVVGVGAGAVQWHVTIDKVLKPSVIAPTLGFVVALLFSAVLMRVFRNTNPRRSNRLFRNLQVFSGGWLSLTHGMNDAQKTMGIIALALVSTGHLGAEDDIPGWVILSAASAMALGTYAGGWKIIKTLGGKIVKMSPLQGFSASVSSAAILYFAGHNGLPVSTTHCVSGSVMGAGASRRFSAVRWGVAGDIVTAWIVTLPSASLVGAIAYVLVAIHPLVLFIAAGSLLWYLRTWASRPGAVPAH